MYVAEKRIKGRTYLYLMGKQKVDGRWKTVTIAYLGKSAKAAMKALGQMEIQESARQKLIASLDSDCWETPAHVIAAVREVLGGIDLDPTTKPANPTGAAQFFTKEDDCLTRQWHGTVYMNPPYSKPAPFLEKLVTEYREGRVTQAIALCKQGVLSNKGTGKLIHQSKSAQCLWEGRLDFKHSSRKQKGNSNNFDVVAIYWGPAPDRFKEVFSQFGFVS